MAERVHARIGDIAAGKVGAPKQLHHRRDRPADALVNHEYQHDQWIGEVRAANLGHALPPDPESDQLSRVDGYLVISPWA